MKRKTWQDLAVLLLALTFVPALAAQTSEGPRKVLIKKAAIYPTLAQNLNIHGIVKLEAVVKPNGEVKTIDVKGGHPILTQSAVTAVGHWKFEPAAHETREVIEIKFDQ